MRSHHLSVVRLSGLSVCPSGGGPPYQHHAKRRPGEDLFEDAQNQTN